MVIFKVYLYGSRVGWGLYKNRGASFEKSLDIKTSNQTWEFINLMLTYVPYLSSGSKERLHPLLWLDPARFRGKQACFLSTFVVRPARFEGKQACFLSTFVVRPCTV